MELESGSEPIEISQTRTIFAKSKHPVTLKKKMELESGLEPVDGLRTRSISAKSKHLVTLKFEDVVYKIKTNPKPGAKKNQATERVILKGVSGLVLPGEMLAMMGPSGSGKTTLLTALGGRLGGNLTGEITYNGRPFSASMNRNIGFVTQDDVLYPHLTVTETLVYTALLRLPATQTRQEKAAQAEAVMAELGLTACRHNIIGGPMLRGVSGGERKRVSVGQEMLINPSLLYLDEPTSGLDSTTAQRIVATLSGLTRGGRTVVMTIHQPSSSLFYMFDKVFLLSDGNALYFGKGDEAMDYFASIGYAPLVPMNPADFLLDLANGVSSHEEAENRAAVKEALVAAYDQHLRDKVKQGLQEVGGNEVDGGGEPQRPTSQWTTSWWEQFTILLERGMKERRHESFSGLKITEIVFMSLLSSALWWRSDERLQDQVGFLFFLCGFWAFYPVYQAIFTFPQERMMLTKERSSRMYRLSSYFMARMVGDLPMELILPTVFLMVTYWMTGLKRRAANFFVTLLTLLLNVLVAQGIGLAVGALIMDLKAATTLASVIMLTFQLAGGYFVQKVPAFIAWIKYVSLNFNSFKLLASSQYDESDTYQCAPAGTCKITDMPTIAKVGLRDQYVSVLILLAMFFLCRIVSYLALTRVGVTK